MVNDSINDIIFNMGEFSKIAIPEKKSILTPWITEQSIILVTGFRGTGKTWLALSLCDAITKGESFGPWKTSHPVPCLYLDGEMPAKDTQDRLKCINANTNDRKQPFYIYSDAYANYCGFARANMLSPIWRDNMKSILLNREVKLFIIDNIASLSSGLDENKKQDWDPINSWLLDLRFAGISTMLLHHTNKEGGQRGTSAREDNLDVSIMLGEPKGYNNEDGAKFVMKFSKSRIQVKDLCLIKDTEFHLVADNDNNYSWVWKNPRDYKRKEILEMIENGESYSVIAKTLGVHKSYVGKVKKDDK